ncbi:NADPH oxidase 5 isoform X2 [Plodia interpunctella]
MQNRVVTNKLLRAVDADGDGAASADELMELLGTATSSRARAGIDKQSVDRLERLFRDTVGDQKEITKEQFRKILDSKNPFFTERVFQIFDEDNSGSISLHEFIAAAHRFAGQTPDDKIRFLFEVYDMDGDGLIQQRELQHVLWACMEENGMVFSDEQLTQLTRAMFEDADAEGRGAITYEALRHQLAKHEGLRENLSISIDRWLVPPKPARPTSSLQRLRRLRPHQLSLAYLRNNLALVGYLLVFSAVNMGLFAARCVEYRGQSVFLMMARACGQCLNFNCSWVLVLMLRRCITMLRVRGLGAVLPLDHHIYLHKLTGVLILALSAVHTVMHLFNFSMVVVKHPVYNAENYTVFEWLLTEKPHTFGLVSGCANPTGFALVVFLTVMIVCSQPFIRRRGSFEVFYWTHLLYVPFWLLLVFHAPNFWKWFVLPAAVYLAERALRLMWLRSEHGKTYISSGILLPSRVTHLVVKRPPLFDFHAGDYVFVNIPAIATYEWHPFTISSAPDQPDYIWLHIRGVGQWTNRLYSYFEQEHARLHANAPPHSPVSRLSSAASARSRRKSSTPSHKKRSVDFAPQVTGVDNPAFTPDTNVQSIVQTNGDSKLQVPGLLRGAALLTPMRFHKSRSMPDVYKQKHIALRDYMRSESESNFDSNNIQSACESHRRGYSALHNRHLADSFRYLRHKPAIVACKAPSEERPRRRSNDSIITIARRRLSKSLSPDKDVEAEKHEPEPSALAEAPLDYPVGKPLEIFVDGPYGAASSHIFRAQHAALIAAGIGVTPFASILQSIMYRYWSARAECPACGHRFPTALPHHNMSLNKVDFFWINREQRSFEWFVSLLSQLEMEQAELGGRGERFLDMHMYITSALQRTDMRAVGLQLALDLLHERDKRDLITGLKTRTNAGRPNWDKVFQQLQQQNKGKVTVFYCGPPQLARALRLKCDRFGFHFRKETF